MCVLSFISKYVFKLCRCLYNFFVLEIIIILNDRIIWYIDFILKELMDFNYVLN